MSGGRPPTLLGAARANNPVSIRWSFIGRSHFPIRKGPEKYWFAAPIFFRTGPAIAIMSLTEQGINRMSGD